MCKNGKQETLEGHAVTPIVLFFSAELKKQQQPQPQWKLILLTLIINANKTHF